MMITLGVPYAEDFPEKANADIERQANEIVESMRFA